MVPGQAGIQVLLKVKVEVKGHVIRALSSCHENRSFSRANGSIVTKLHTMFPGQARIQDVLKVKVDVKGHVIRALLSCHKNCFFSRANGSIATEHSQQGPQKGLHTE